MSHPRPEKSNNRPYELLEHLDFVLNKEVPLVVPEDLQAQEYIFLAEDYVKYHLVHQALDCLDRAVSLEPSMDQDCAVFRKMKLPAVIPPVEAVELVVLASDHRRNFCPERFDADFFDSYVEVAQRCVARFPDCELGHFVLGELEIWRGNLKTAIAAFERVHELNPLNVNAMNELARIYLSKSKYLRALAWYQKALGVDETDHIALHGQEHVKDTLSDPAHMLYLKYRWCQAIRDRWHIFKLKRQMRRISLQHEHEPSWWKREPGGIIDKTGTFIFRSEEVVSFNNFSNGFFCAQQPECASFLNLSGRNAFAKVFRWAESFSENLACVFIDEKWGFIDTDGELVIKPQFQDVGSFEQGLAAAQLNDRWGFIEVSGDWIIKPQFDKVLSFSEERAAVCLNNKIAFINLRGEQITEFEFDEAGAFADGRAQTLVYETGVNRRIVRYIDRDGVVVIDLARKYEELVGDSQIFYGRDDVHKYDYLGWGARESLHTFTSRNQISHDKARGQFVDGLLNIHFDGKRAFLDTNGNVAIPFSQRHIDRFSEGLARLTIVAESYHDNRYGFVDKTGTVVIAPTFSYAHAFSDGLVYVEEPDERSFYIDKSGEKVFELTGNKLKPGAFHNGLAAMVPHPMAGM